MKKVVSIAFLVAGLIFTSCNTETSDPGILIDTDMAFSNMSEEEGMSKAFIHYADSAVVLFRDGGKPILGKSALIESFSGNDDSASTLTWKPEYADIAKSGELGYTWGNYAINTKDSLGTEYSMVGNYFSVWKKQTDGDWKFALDGGTTPVPQE